jgi:hypothetical protein
MKQILTNAQCMVVSTTRAEYTALWKKKLTTIHIFISGAWGAIEKTNAQAAAQPITEEHRPFPSSALVT